MSIGFDLGNAGSSCGLAAAPVSCEKSQSVSIEHELLARALDGDGEDAVQETLTLFYDRLGQYAPGTSLRSFLAAIAVRQARTLLRGEQRRRHREDTSAPPQNSPDPVELLAAERLGKKIRDALSTMPKKRQEAALLRLDAGLSYAEIAEAVGSTEGSARVLVHLALQELRELLSDEEVP
jgi:RNA polymerase sigma-70 factor (ECF subfamily)